MTTGPRRTCLDEAEVMSLLAGAEPAGPDGGAKREAQRAHLEACADCQEVIALLATGDGSRARRIDRYRVHRELGRGSMGTVYLAHDPVLDRRVALKVLRQRGPHVERRMRREARSLARLSHPNVVAVFDVGAFDDDVFMVMELIEGGPLRSWLCERPRPREEIIARFLEAGEALLAAHDAGIVHRDFKPDNVLVGKDGRVRVVDFGLAHVETVAESNDGASSDLTTTTHTAAFVGTPAYMAPEQFLGQKADARSDQFAFSVSLAEALFGARPLQASSFAELRDKALRGEVSFPGAGLDPIVKILRRGLMPKPADRYPDMRQLLADLRGRSARTARSKYLAPTAAIGAGAVAVALLGGAWLAGTRDPVARAPSAVASPASSPTPAPTKAAVSAPGAGSLASSTDTPPVASETRPPRIAIPAPSAPRSAATTKRTTPPPQLGVNDTPLLE